MLCSEVEVHGLYTNGRGDYRRVLEVSGGVVVCRIQRLGYGPSHEGAILTMPVDEFAAWARVKVQG